MSNLKGRLTKLEKKITPPPTDNLLGPVIFRVSDGEIISGIPGKPGRPSVWLPEIDFSQLDDETTKREQE